MKDKETKTTIRETLGLLGFGFKTAHKLLPAYYPCMLLRSLVTSVQPLIVLFLSARILNELSGARNVSSIVLYASAAVGLTFLLSVLKAVLVREIDCRAGREQAIQRVRMMQAERFATMDFAHTEDTSVSELLVRMDTHTVSTSRGLVYLYIVPERAADSLFSLILAVLLLGPLSAGSADLFSSWAGLALLVLFVAGLLIGFRLQAREKNLMQRIAARAVEDNTLAWYYSDYVKADQAAKDIRIYDQKNALSSIFKESHTSDAWISLSNFRGRINGVRMGFLAAIAGGVYLLAGYNALGSAVPAGNIVQTVGAVSALAAALGALISTAGMIYNNTPFIKPMKEFLSLPDVLKKGGKEVPPRESHIHQIEFRNVSFRYPGAETYALKNLDLKLVPGERLAVVGLNGSGKTTMVKLLCRLYDPTEGEILLDGVNIKEYDYEQYIALFSVVFQDYVLFPLRLGQNVAAGESYETQRVTECLDRAGLAERRAEMKDGLDTILYKEYDENGVSVSGGESQKIALARALYKNAPFVVLDEPTAALDPISEFEVYSKFNELIGEKTAVFISHRLSSCRFCDDIAVFHDGKLIQRGGHDFLLADEGGKYFELWNAQAQHYVSEGHYVSGGRFS